MREILFRGKDILGHWLYGGFHLWKTRQPCVMDDELKPEEIKHIIIQNSFADWNMPRTMQPYVVIPETVGQYTGLTDKNGNKIFEGDIVVMNIKGCNTICKVAWADNVAQFQLWQTNTIPHTSTALNLGNYDCEVIGNIHDNPELLKECVSNV